MDDARRSKGYGWSRERAALRPRAEPGRWRLRWDVLRLASGVDGAPDVVEQRDGTAGGHFYLIHTKLAKTGIVMLLQCDHPEGRLLRK